MIRRRLIWLLGSLSIASFARAEDGKTIIFWDTVSPNGEYALAWTKSGSIDPDNMPYPDDKEGGCNALNALTKLERAISANGINSPLTLDNFYCCVRRRARPVSSGGATSALAR